MRQFIICAAIALIFAPRLLLAQQLPGDKVGYSLSPVRTVQLKSSAYLYTSMEIREADMGAVIAPIMDQFANLMSTGQFVPTGGPVMIFQGDLADRNKPILLKVGYPVADNTKPVGGFQVGRLDGRKAATALFMGRDVSLGQAYEKMYTQIAIAGLKPADERREHFLYYEDPTSANNVRLIEIELEN
jgi:hypothetical protein